MKNSTFLEYILILIIILSQLHALLGALMPGHVWLVGEGPPTLYLSFFLRILTYSVFFITYIVIIEVGSLH